MLLIGYVPEVWLLPMTDRLPGRGWLEIDKLEWQERGAWLEPVGHELG